MKNVFKIISIILLISSFSFGAKISGIDIPDTLGNGLVLNGAGIRSKFFFDLYVGGLYLKEKSNNALHVINSDEQEAITLPPGRLYLIAFDIRLVST